MKLQSILNASGLLITIGGAYMMFHFSPKVKSHTWLYTEAEADKIKKRDGYKNKMVRNGMFLLFVGFLLQFLALLF